jgi:hypothetical protein
MLFFEYKINSKDKEKESDKMVKSEMLIFKNDSEFWASDDRTRQQS